MLNNIYRCRDCGLYAIAEEKDEHVCMEIKDSRIEGNLRMIFDGILWYPLKIKKRSARSDDFFHEEQPDKDYTEPLKDGFKYYASFLVIR